VDRQEVTRLKLAGVRKATTLRALAEQIGVSDALIHQFLRGKRVRESTLARIERWLEGSSDGTVAERLVGDLRALLKSLPEPKQRALRRRLAIELERAFRQQGLPRPAWVDHFRP
jgi:transcriptional regulator with XRE-family HTH domain